MKKLLSLVLVLCLLLGCLCTTVSAEEADKPKIGFVVIGLGGEFFQMLSDTYVKTFTELGWDATYVNGNFNPATQIEAVENYIAQDVDVLVLWSISGAALSSTAEQARQAGIKLVAFVEPTETYDLLMLSDDRIIAQNCCKLATRWVEEHFADAPDGSVRAAVITYTAAENNTIQSNTLCEIAQYSPKFNPDVVVYEVPSEETAQGIIAAENLYTQYPDIDVFLTAQGGVALGVNNYYTSLSSPVTDYTDMGIFCINGSSENYEAVRLSKTNEAPLRGIVMTGSVQDTVNEVVTFVTALLDGTIESGYVRYAENLLLCADTIDEFLATGKVTTLTTDDLMATPEALK